MKAFRIAVDLCLIAILGFSFSVQASAAEPCRGCYCRLKKPSPGCKALTHDTFHHLVSSEVASSRLQQETGLYEVSVDLGADISGVARIDLTVNGRPFLSRHVTPSLVRRARASGLSIELGVAYLEERSRLALKINSEDSDSLPSAELRLRRGPDSEAMRDRTVELRAAHNRLFHDEFQSLVTNSDLAPRPALWSSDLRHGQRIHPSSPDSFFSDADFSDWAGLAQNINPFQVTQRGVTIQAGEIRSQSGLDLITDKISTRMSRRLATTKPNNTLRFYSGLLQTRTSWSQTYGYFEARLKLPRGQGFWPAFWLVASRGWPPELDILEAIYHETGYGENLLHMAVHYNDLSADKRAVGPRYHHGPRMDVSTVFGADFYDSFHLYAAEWTPEWTSLYFDGRLVFKSPTPPQMHVPMVMIVNLQVGTRAHAKRWASDVVDTNIFRNVMEVDYVSAYRLRNGAPGAMPHRSGRSGDDEIVLGKGAEVAAGGKGADRFVIPHYDDAHKIILDFSEAEGDKLVFDPSAYDSPQAAVERSVRVGEDLWITRMPGHMAPQTVVLRGRGKAGISLDAVEIRPY